VQAFKDCEIWHDHIRATMFLPWFPVVKWMCRDNPEIDMGVHATLNAEWDSYRWGPLSTRDPASGLLDVDGYFHQWQDAVYENAKPEAKNCCR
jgi:hypothetical protein